MRGEDFSEQELFAPSAAVKVPGIDRCEERSEDGHARRLQVQRHAPTWAVAALVAPVRDVLRRASVVRLAAAG